MQIASRMPTQKENEAFGRRLIEARTKRKPGMSAPEAAAAMHLAYPTYKSHENGSRGATKGAVDRYARFYRVDRRWLMFGEGTMDGKGADRVLEGLDDDDKAQDWAEVMRFIDFVRTRKVKIRNIK